MDREWESIYWYYLSPLAQMVMAVALFYAAWKVHHWSWWVVFASVVAQVTSSFLFLLFRLEEKMPFLDRFFPMHVQFVLLTIASHAQLVLWPAGFVGLAVHWWRKKPEPSPA